MWKGLGINYNYQGVGANYRVDIPLIRKAGFKHIRLLVCDYLDTSPTGIPLWKTILEYALTFDFETITIGLSSNPTTLTNSNKGNFTAAFTTPSSGFAYYIASLNDPRIIVCIGNEETYHHDGSISDTQTRAFIRTHYAAIKPLLPNNSLTYSMANGEMYPFYSDYTNSNLSYPWDFPSANLYSYPTGQGSNTYYSINLSSATAWFGNSTLVVSEFGPDEAGYADSRWGDKDFYTAQFVDNELDIIDHGIKKGFIYNFMNDAFGCKSQSGVFRPWWYALRGEQVPVNAGMI